MNESEEGRLPWFDNDCETIGTQDSPHLCKGQVEVIGELRQMMQTALDDHDVSTMAFEGQGSTVTNVSLCRPLVLGE